MWCAALLNGPPFRVSPVSRPVSRPDLQLGRPLQPTRRRLSLKIHKLAVDGAARTGTLSHAPVTNDEDDSSHSDSLGHNDSDGESTRHDSTLSCVWALRFVRISFWRGIRPDRGAVELSILI